MRYFGGELSEDLILKNTFDVGGRFFAFFSLPHPSSQLLASLPHGYHGKDLSEIKVISRDWTTGTVLISFSKGDNLRTLERQ